MSLTTLPTRDPADLGAALTDTRTPLANELSAVNVEALKDRVIEIGTDLGIDTTPAAGSVKARLDDLEAASGGGPLWEWNGADLAQFDSQLDHARNGGGGPSGTATFDVIADPRYPNRNVLRASLSSGQGGFILPIATAGLTLPARYTIEVVCSQTATVANAYAGIVGFAVDGSNIQGISVCQALGTSPALYTGAIIADAGGAGGDILAPTGGFTTGYANRRWRLRAEIEAPYGSAQSEFSIQSSLQPAVGAVTASSGTRADSAVITTQWDNLTFDRLGIHVVVQTTSASPVVYFHQIRVWEA